MEARLAQKDAFFSVLSSPVCIMQMLMRTFVVFEALVCCLVLRRQTGALMGSFTQSFFCKGSDPTA